MNSILVINSSISGDASVSRTLADYTVRQLLAINPNISVVHRDLSFGTAPHLTPDTAAGVRAVAKTPNELAAAALSDELIDEVRSADVIVVGAPMYNWSLPTTLRAWFDHVVRPRVTFAYGENGAEGMLTGKRAIVLQARGGHYSDGPSMAINFQEPYLRQLLGFIGITDIAFVSAEGIGHGPEARQAAIAAAKEQINKIVHHPCPDPTPSASTGSVDHAALMHTNLTRVFSEPDPARRIVAIREIYAVDAVLVEPQKTFRGHEEISQAVTDLLTQMPPGFGFTALRPALFQQGVGRLQWVGSKPNDAPTVTGLDVARIEAGKIRSLHVFIDQSEA